MKRLILTAALVLGTANAAMASPIYFPSGPQTGVASATIVAGGWTECYAATMSVFIGSAAEGVLTPCTGTYILMAGRETGASSFIVLAAALRSDAIFDTGNTSDTHLANGSNWWFSDDWSWGFVAANDTVVNNECDISDSPIGMCLHTVNGAGGYRINNIMGLNSSVGYEKVFYQASDREGIAAVPEPATLGLLGIGLLAGASRLRRRA